jgi:hypothetical protein
MINEKFILAAGSPDFARKLAAIFQREGWQARVITNGPSALRFLEEKREVPKYLVADEIKGWVSRLAEELHPRGTQVILSGGMSESHEELESMLGTPYYSIMGSPWKVAIVLLGKEFREEDMARPLFPAVEIQVMRGSVFDKDLQRKLGLDGLVAFRRRSFNPMDAFTREYMRDPSPALEGRTAIWSYDRHPAEGLARRKLAEMLTEVSDNGGRVIGISQIEFCARDGEIIDDRRADEKLLQWVGRYMAGPGSFLPIRAIYILIDPRCKMLGARRFVPPRPGRRIPARTGACEQVFCRRLDKSFVERMGIDAIIDPIKRGFSVSQESWKGYIQNPAHGVKLVSFMYDRNPGSALTVPEYTKMMNGLIDALVYQNAKVIATFPLYLIGEDGQELTRSQDDETVMAYLTDWLQRHPDQNVRLLYLDGDMPRV